MDKYQYQQHPHVANRQHPAEKVVKLGLNNRIGLWVTRHVGTMWAAYLFFALTLVSLPAALGSGNVIVIVSWIAQTFLQLVLLPIIIVGQNIQAKASDDRAIATYEDATALLHQVEQMQQHLAHQDAQLEKLREDLAK